MQVGPESMSQSNGTTIRTDLEDPNRQRRKVEEEEGKTNDPLRMAEETAEAATHQTEPQDRKSVV